MPENWHTWCLEDYDSYCDTSFLDFQTKVHFWTELGPGNEIVCFVWCSDTLYLNAAGFFHMKYVTEEDNEGL